MSAQLVLGSQPSVSEGGTSVSETIQFFVAGHPKSMRVGGVARFLRAGKMQTVPKREHSEWALLVGQIARQHAPVSPWSGPVALELLFKMPRPKSAGRKRVAWPIKRPDIDNLFHKITDSLNGVVWHDDAQIVRTILEKVYADDGRPGLEVKITSLDP